MNDNGFAKAVLMTVLVVLLVFVGVGLQWCTYSGISASSGHDPSVLEFVGLKMLLGR